MKIENLGRISECIIDLFLRPDIECTFGILAVTGVADPGYHWAVRIFGREKSAFLRGHVARDVVENITRNRFHLRIARDLKRVEIDDGELRLIVKHLFEVRHVPVTIDRVAMKTATEMIVHSASRHFAQRDQIHFQGVLAVVAFWIARIEACQKI